METTEEVHYTPRELEIIRLFLMSFSRKEMADVLEISEDTVKTHLKHLMEKTETHCIEDLIIYVLKHGFDVNVEQTEVTYNGKII